MEYKLKDEENVYEILYYHNYGVPTIQNYVCVATDKNGALQRFWDGRNKDAWEVKEIHSYVNPLKKMKDEVEKVFKDASFITVCPCCFSELTEVDSTKSMSSNLNKVTGIIYECDNCNRFFIDKGAKDLEEFSYYC